MGSGASTTTTKVDRIRIDQNGDIWKKKKNGTEKLCRPPSSLHSVFDPRKRNGSRSNSLHSKNSREQSASSADTLRTKIESLELSKVELETTVHQLQHRLHLLELEKGELLEELAYYKHQLNNNQDEMKSIGYFKDKNAEDEGDESLHVKSKLDRELYENLVQKLQNELKEQQEKHQRRLEFERELREKMEDVVRIHLGDAFLYDAKNSLAHDTLPVVKSFQSAKPLCRNLLSSHGRLSTPGNASTNFVQPIEEESIEETRRSISQTEIFQVHDEPSDYPMHFQSVRPSTADVNVTVSNKASNQIGRGESAPILYKRSKSREKRIQLRKKKPEPDKESIDSHSIDEEIEDILSCSFSSLSNSIGSSKKQNIPSAKSRDSGYLGESANFESDTKFDALNVP